MEYRRISKLQLCGIAGGAFFVSCVFAGCSAIFPPLLIITVPAALVAPFAVAFGFRHAIFRPVSVLRRALR